MEKKEQKKNVNGWSFYFLLTILGLGVLYILGYLLYDMLFM